MKHLRNLSSRPEVVVDPHARRVFDPTDKSRVGIPGPFGRERLIFALPINGSGPVRLSAPIVVHDQNGAYVADPDGILLGMAGTVVSRFLAAGPTAETRRLG